MFSLQQNCRTQRWNRFSLEGGGWEGAQTMYSHVSKCKNDKIKEEKKNLQSNSTKSGGDPTLKVPLASFMLWRTKIQ
jgi:hypothetical protein